MKKGIVDDMERCMICGREHPHIHHVFFGTANRRKSEKYHLTVPLCREHHEGAEGPHMNRAVDLALKVMAQEYFESHYGSREDFRREFGRSYL